MSTGGEPQVALGRSSLLRGSGWSLLLAALFSAWVAFFYLHPKALVQVGVHHFQIGFAGVGYKELWFFDLLAVLAANDAAAAGIDPYTPNRFDFLSRPHVYGPLWLCLRHFGITRQHLIPLGLILGIAFVIVAIRVLSPKSAGACLWSAGVLLTTPVLLALERANNDLVVFLLLTPVVPLLVSERRFLGWLAVVLIAFAAALKYYPAVAAIVLLGAGAARIVRSRLAVSALGLLLIAVQVVALVPKNATVPQPDGIFSFGGIAVFRELGVRAMWPQVVVILSALIAVVLWWRSSWFRDWQPGLRWRREWLYFILGSAVLTGCFFIGQHFAYRWIFAVWMAPFWWVVLRARETPLGVRRIAKVTTVLFVIMLWAEPLFVLFLHQVFHQETLQAAHVMALVMQPFTWAFFLLLLGFITHFVRTGLANLSPRMFGSAAAPPAIPS